MEEFILIVSAVAVILTPQRLREAEAALAAADPVMARLIHRHTPCKLAKRQQPFHVLTTSIINQQLSQTAANAITARVAQLTPMPFTAAPMRRLPPQELRAAGLSASKIKYLHNLAEADAAGLLDAAALRMATDEDVVSRLVTIRGVGKWTAEMFLMFGLRRADVLSLGDAGLRRAARILYGNRFRGDDEQVLEKAARRWQPWRTVACWHLWKSLDTT